MSKEELEKLEREKYVVERKLTAAMHKEKRLQSELKRLTRSERTHRLCTRAGMLETFLKEPTTLTDDDVIQTAVADCEKHKAVHDKYIKIGWKIRKEAYVESHKDELTAFNKAYRILKKHGADLNVDLKALQKEYDGLRTTHADLKEQLAAVNEELKPMKDIRYWVSKVLSPEQTGEKQPEPKHSLKERLQYEQEQKKQKQVQKAPKQKKQDMEL